MFHMTFGCNWHHGVGTAACASQCSSMACNDDDKTGSNGCGASDRECREHDMDHEQGPEPAPNDSVNGAGKSRNHSSCQDDSCDVTEFLKFVFLQLDFSTQYLGGTGSSAITGSQNNGGFGFDPFPDRSYLPTGLRAHLVLGVQIL